MGPQDQPDYVNALCVSQQAYCRWICCIACKHRNDRPVRKGERWGENIGFGCLDYGDQEIDLPGFNRTPHKVWMKIFVLYPLLKLAPAIGCAW